MDIAVVGSGISGLTVSYLLDDYHRVTIYEKNDTAGGHANTVPISTDSGDYDVDTGFIVYNKQNYPRFTQLLSDLNVSSSPTSMGFSFSDRQSGLEYSGSGLNQLFNGFQNVFRDDFITMFRDLLRFYFSHNTGSFSSDTRPLGKYLSDESYSKSFRRNHLIPMASAIWSTPPSVIKQFPINKFLEFFNRHGLLEFFDRPQWYHLPGGSKSYVQQILENTDSNLRLNTTVSGVDAQGDHVEVHTESDRDRHDAVVMATHADTSLEILRNPSNEHVNILSSVPYGKSSVYVHSDERVMPQNKNLWSAWNYVKNYPDTGDKFVSYDLNILQNIDSSTPLIETVTMDNTYEPKNPYCEFSYSHPRFDENSFQAQNRLSQINGKDDIYFCGAYWGFGFHEDGVNSGYNVAREINGGQSLG